LEKCVFSIFLVKELAEQEASMKQAAVRTDGGGMFLLNAIMSQKLELLMLCSTHHQYLEC
jgi:hypothetical protein